MTSRCARAGSVLASMSMLALPACAAPVPLCSRAPDAGFAYPAGATGEMVAEYIRAFDSGDPAAMRELGRRRRSARAKPLTEEEADASYGKMRDALGCIEPRAVTRRGGEGVLLVETAREGYYELSFRLDEAQRVLAVHGAPAMPPGQNEPASLAEAIASIDALVSDLAAHDRFAGVVLVADHGRPILARAVGLADRAAGIPHRLETRFNIGSIGKMFTGVAVAQLADAGKLRFDEPVGDVLRDYPLADARRVTLHQLLTHTSGLGDVTGFLDARPPLRTPADFIARFGRAPLAFEPGREHRYSNFGFVVLGRAVEIASGEPFDAYLRAHVFAPAGMNETGPAPVDASLRATPYTRRRESGSHGERRDATSLVPPMEPFGCEVSPAMDLARFGEALFADKLLRPETTRLVTTVRVARDAPAAGDAGDASERGYGYGFGVERMSGVRVVAHEGGTFGVSATLGFLPDQHLTVVVLANDDPPAAPRIGARALRLLAHVAAHE